MGKKKIQANIKELKTKTDEEIEDFFPECGDKISAQVPNWRRSCGSFRDGEAQGGPGQGQMHFQFRLMMYFVFACSLRSSVQT